ncbi:MAG: AsmA-like C-terminal region-containing protein [Pseudomonadota bacterium]
MVGFASAGVLLAALALALAHQRLSEGPIALPQIARLAQDRLNASGPLVFDVGAAVFSLGNERAPSGLRLLDVSAATAEGEPVFGAPEISLSFRLADLLGGALRPTAIDVAGVSLRVVRDADGGFALAGFSAAPGADATRPAPEAWTGDLTAMLDAAAAGEGVLGALRRVDGRDLSVIFEDDVSDRDWIAAEASATLSLTPRRQAFALSAQIFPVDEISDAALAPARAALTAERSVEDGALSAQLRLDDARLPQLAQVIPELAALSPLQARASGRLNLRADAAGRLQAMDGSLRIGEGRLVGMPPGSEAFQSLELDLGWTAATGALDITRAELRADAAHAVLSGRLTPWEAVPSPSDEPDASLGPDASGATAAAAGAVPLAYAVDLDLSLLELTPEAGFDDVVVFDLGRLEGDLLLQARRLEVSRLHLAGSDLSLTANGSVAAVEGGAAVAARLASDGFSTEALLQHWPLAAAPGGRRWLDANLLEGRIASVDLWVWSTPGETPEVTLDFAFDGLAARVVPGMTPVEGARGVGRASLDRLDLSFEAGTASPPGGGAVDLGGSTFAIPDLRAQPAIGVARIAARASIAEALALLDQPPLRLVSRLDADLGRVEGRAEVAATLTLPLLRGLPISDVVAEAEATLLDVALRAPDTDLDVTSPRLALSATTSALTLQGPAAIEGAPVRLFWNERFGPGQAGRTLRLAARLDDAALNRLGFEQVQIRDGAVDAELTLEGVETPLARLTADLSGAALRVPNLAWRKSAGTFGRLEAEARLLGGGGVDVRALTLDAPGLEAVGSLRLDAEGAATRADFSRLVLGRTLDVELEMGPAEAGGLQARVGGRMLHLGRLSRLRRAFGAAGDEADEASGRDAAAGLATPFDARIEVRRVIAAEGVEVRRVRGDVSRRDGVTRAALRGRVNGGGPARLRYRQGLDGDAVLTIRAADAGLLLGDLGLTENADGGRLVLRARIPPEGEGDISGVAEIEDIRVGGGRALGEVVAEAAERGLDARPAGGGGYAFETVTVPFVLDGERLSVSDALAEGPSLGLKVGGAFLRDSGQLDFTGVITPAYQLNSFLNDVPLLGAILGGRGEGVFGLTFAVTGPREAPSVSVNPLSALAPGILRRLVQSAPSVDVPPNLFDEIDR